jgi:hypothetical protein
MECLSYSSFINDSKSFNSEEYLQNLKQSIFLDNFNNFILIYKEIENEDFKKPVFSQTTKFKKIPNYKFVKINRDGKDAKDGKDGKDCNSGKYNKDGFEKELKNSWVVEGPKNDNEKISMIIKSYMNKITEDNYKEISNQFINELLLISLNDKLFDIICYEILNKCLHDNKYRYLYINLASKIWLNKEIHLNMIHIEFKNDSYFWNSKNNVAIYGPFNSQQNAVQDAFTKINFKKHFLNYIQKQYKEKDLELDNLSDDDFFLKKKKVLMLVELISRIYLEKYINFDIINIIIIDLLHLNNNFKNIVEIEFEALYILLKLIKDVKKTYSDLNDNKLIFGEFIDIINKINKNSDLSKRSSFFIDNILEILNKFIENINKKSNDKVNGYDKIVGNDSKKMFLNCLENENYKNLDNNYKNLNLEDKKYVFLKVLNSVIETKNKDLIHFLSIIQDKDIIEESIKICINNMEDIMLDVANANTNLIYIIKYFNIDIKNKELYIEQLNKLNDDESTESESDYEDEDSIT